MPTALRIPGLCFSAIITRTFCLESCGNIRLTGSGPPDGIYQTLVDYRGRPDFYRDDGKYNLFGEERDDNTCYWRIDSSLDEFPYYSADDCSYHPVTIGADWYVYNLGLDAEVFEPDIACIESDNSNADLIRYVSYSLATVIGTSVLAWGHVLARRRRIRKAKRECPICTKSARDAARVVAAAFK